MNILVLIAAASRRCKGGVISLETVAERRGTAGVVGLLGACNGGTL